MDLTRLEQIGLYVSHGKTCISLSEFDSGLVPAPGVTVKDEHGFAFSLEESCDRTADTLGAPTDECDATGKPTLARWNLHRW